MTSYSTFKKAPQIVAVVAFSVASVLVLQLTIGPMSKSNAMVVKTKIGSDGGKKNNITFIGGDHKVKKYENMTPAEKAEFDKGMANFGKGMEGMQDKMAVQKQKMQANIARMKGNQERQQENFSRQQENLARQLENMGQLEINNARMDRNMYELEEKMKNMNGNMQNMETGANANQNVEATGNPNYDRQHSDMGKNPNALVKTGQGYKIKSNKGSTINIGNIENQHHYRDGDGDSNSTSASTPSHHSGSGNSFPYIHHPGHSNYCKQGYHVNSQDSDIPGSGTCAVGSDPLGKSKRNWNPQVDFNRIEAVNIVNDGPMKVLNPVQDPSKPISEIALQRINNIPALKGGKNMASTNKINIVLPNKKPTDDGNKLVIVSRGSMNSVNVSLDEKDQSVSEANNQTYKLESRVHFCGSAMQIVKLDKFSSLGKADLTHSSGSYLKFSKAKENATIAVSPEMGGLIEIGADNTENVTVQYVMPEKWNIMAVGGDAAGSADSSIKKARTLGALVVNNNSTAAKVHVLIDKKFVGKGGYKLTLPKIEGAGKNNVTFSVPKEQWSQGKKLKYGDKIVGASEQTNLATGLKVSGTTGTASTSNVDGKSANGQSQQGQGQVQPKNDISTGDQASNSNNSGSTNSISTTGQGNQGKPKSGVSGTVQDEQSSINADNMNNNNPNGTKGPVDNTVNLGATITDGQGNQMTINNNGQVETSNGCTYYLVSAIVIPIAVVVGIVFLIICLCCCCASACCGGNRR